MPRGPEAKIQDASVKNARKMGCMAIKLDSTTYSGLPDYLFSHINCGPFLMEFKAPGSVPRPLQIERQKQMADAGFVVFSCVSSTRVAAEIVEDMVNRRKPRHKPVAGL